MPTHKGKVTIGDSLFEFKDDAHYCFYDGDISQFGDYWIRLIENGKLQGAKRENGDKYLRWHASNGYGVAEKGALIIYRPGKYDAFHVVYGVKHVSGPKAD